MCGIIVYRMFFQTVFDKKTNDGIASRIIHPGYFEILVHHLGETGFLSIALF